LDKDDLQNLSATKIIEGYIDFAYKLAVPFYKSFKNKSSDIKGAALLGLCEGVCAAIKQKKREYIPNFIYLYVRQHILEELANSALVSIPRSFIRKKRKEAYTKGESFSYKELYAIMLSTTGEDFVYDIGQEDFRWQEILDLFKFLELTEFESQVVLRRVFKYRMREIAEEFECSPNWINLTMKRVKEKWHEKNL
jgi:hypothetical protein